LLIVGIAAPSASAACNPPRSVSTYNPTTGQYVYWHTSFPVVGSTLVGRIWQNGLDFTGTCNDVAQAGQSRIGFLYFGATAGDIGMNLTLGDACVVGCPAPDSSPLQVQAIVTNGVQGEFLVTQAAQNVTLGINYDFAPQGPHPMIGAPRAKVLNSSRTPSSGGGTVNLGVRIDASSSGFYNGTGASDITGYNVLSAQGPTDPGRKASAYTLRNFISAPGGSQVDGSTAVDCTNLALGKQWVVMQLVTTSGGPSSIVGPATPVQCDPALAEPGKYKIVPKPKVVPNSKAKR
jgi:hypothetical protein